MRLQLKLDQVGKLLIQISLFLPIPCIALQPIEITNPIIGEGKLQQVVEYFRNADCHECKTPEELRESKLVAELNSLGVHIVVIETLPSTNEGLKKAKFLVCSELLREIIPPLYFSNANTERLLIDCVHNDKLTTLFKYNESKFSELNGQGYPMWVIHQDDQIIIRYGSNGLKEIVASEHKND